MNYALDALWWRLHDPAVRDLAALLTAPPLWDSGSELPVRTLLGEQGFRWLLALDAQAQALHRHLAAEAPFGHRLGHYAESLLAFWLAQAPHAELLAHDWPLYDAAGRQLGAADFVCRLNGTLWHLELACKYYGKTLQGDWRGLNPHDRLADKAAKIRRQSRLLARPEAAVQLQANWPGETLHRATVIRGMTFAAAEGPPAPPLHIGAWQGVLLAEWTDYVPMSGQRFCWLPRLSYLAPAKVKEADTCTFESLTAQDDGLAAVVVRRPDGYWHEVLRLMRRKDPATG